MQAVTTGCKAQSKKDSTATRKLFNITLNQAGWVRRSGKTEENRTQQATGAVELLAAEHLTVDASKQVFIDLSTKAVYTTVDKKASKLKLLATAQF